MYEFQRKELDTLERVVHDETAEPMSLTLPLLRHITNDFSPESQIGTDEFAVVYLGVLPSGFRVAVKKFHRRNYSDEEAAFKNEVSIAMKAAHKNTVRLIGYCHHTQDQFVEYEGKQVFAGVDERLICMEYVPNSTLYRHVEGKICTGMDIYEFQSVELDALECVVRDESAEPMNLTLPLLRHITNDFSPESEIGSGGYAVVYLGVLPSGLRIAVKKLYQMHSDDGLFRNEVSITMKTAHKHTVRLIGYCSHDGAKLIEHNGQHVFRTIQERLICLEYLPYGTICPHIDNYSGRLDWSQRYQILKGICQGLRYLHDELHVFHGDIKPDNIFIGDNLVPKIIDFGLSRCFDEGEPSGYMERLMGTYAYMAPEMMAEQRWSTKSDIYSFGVIVTELITGEKGPQPTVQVLKQLRKRLVEEGAFSSWENKYQQIKTCLEIGYTCREIDPDKRPTALEIIRLLDETECPNHSAPSLWESLDEEPDSSVTEAFETETTTDFLPSDEEPASSDTTGETSTQEPEKPDLVSNLPVLVELSDLKFLEKITDGFSHKRIVGKDGTRTGYAYPKAFVYKGKIPRREMIAVKRLIGVRIQAETFMSKAQQFMSLDHKNIVKVAGYCQDESTTYRRVHFKGEPEPIPVVIGPEQLVCYEYMHKGSLQEYLIGQRSPEIDWHIRYKLIKGTCEGLRYLHNDGGIVHLNLSPSNVLLDDNNGPRITGFDFSKLIGERNTKSVTVQTKGSALAYLPPDFFHKKDTDYNYFCTVDIYSLGLMIIEIVTQEKIKAYDHARLITSVEENWRQESQLARLYTSLEADKLRQVKLCIDIGLRCVKSVPEMRPTARNIVRWLDKGSKPAAAPRAGAGVPRPPVRTSVNRDDHSQGMKKLTGFMEQLFRRK